MSTPIAIHPQLERSVVYAGILTSYPIGIELLLSNVNDKPFLGKPAGTVLISGVYATARSRDQTEFKVRLTEREPTDGVIESERTLRLEPVDIAVVKTIQGYPHACFKWLEDLIICRVLRPLPIEEDNR